MNFSGMGMNNWPKFVVAVLSILSMTLLMMTETVSSDVGVPFLTAVAGYVLGNGIAAQQHNAQQNMFPDHIHYVEDTDDA